MKLDLNWHLLAGVIIAVMSAIAGGTIHLTNAIPADWIPVVTAWSSIIATAGGLYIAAMSQQTTPPVTPPVAVAQATLAASVAKTAVLIALALAIAAWGGPAHAQTRLPPAAPVARTAPCDPLRLIPGCQTTEAKGIDDLVSRLDTLALPDFEFALAQAQATSNPITVPCWQAWVDLIQARQKAALGADGNPLPLPDPHLATAIERISELLAILRPDSKLYLACVPVASAAGKDAATLITGILSGGALGLFKLPIALP